MVTISEGFLGFSKDQIKEAVDNNMLLSFDVEFSRACNFDCSYCYAGGKAYDEEISYDVITDAINQAAQLGARQIINIGGGEPLMYKFYWEILRAERSLGLQSVTFTNGWYIDQEVAQRLYDMCEDVVLKLNSFDDALQDSISGKEGSGIQQKMALDNLVNAGYTESSVPGLAIQTCVLKQNYNEIETIYRYAREHNIIPYIEVLTCQGNANNKNIHVTVEEAKQLFEKLQKIDEEYGRSWESVPPIAGMRCDRMLYSAYLRADGIVQPCPGVECSGDEYDIAKNMLADIIFTTPVFKDMRNIYKKLKGKCASCGHDDCYGCRGNAFQQTGDYLAEDPFCWV